MTIADVAVVLLPFHAPYSAMEKLKNQAAKTHPTNMHSHIQYTLRIRLYGALLVNLV